MGYSGHDTILQERKPNRMKGYDYSKSGMYFITVCVKDRIEYFGELRDGGMIVNEFGMIVQQQWDWLGNQYNHIKLDAFIVMPNHVHGIICIMDDIPGVGRLGNGRVYTGNGRLGNGPVGNGRDRSLRACHRSDRKIKPIPEIIGAFKTTSSKLIHRAGLESFRWQKSYYDHIIRDNRSLLNIRRYIINNPVKWDMDAENRKNTHAGNGYANIVEYLI